MIHLLAHAGDGYGDNPVFTPWELHPALVHFPIAFLLGGVLLGLYAWGTGRPMLDQVATGLLVAGIVLGVFTALAGFLAWFTMPGTHTESAHQLIYWHLALQAASLVLFTAAAWRRWAAPSSLAVRATGWVAAVVLVLGSALGGYIVYHGGGGIEADLMAPELREGHHHGGGHPHEGEGHPEQTEEPTHSHTAE